MTAGARTAPAHDPVVVAAVSGDPDALQAVWQANRRWVAAVLLMYKSAADDLEDLLQDVAMTLVQKIHTLRDEANVRAWLRTVAINAARASARSGRTRARHHAAHARDLSPLEPDPAAAPPDDADRVMAAVAELPETYREPLVLRAVQGMRSRQIAEILGIPAATVDTRVSRARALLRRALAEADGAEPQTNPRPLDGIGQEVRHGHGT